MPKMLILRGVKNLLDEQPAVEYARERGYRGEVLDVSGEAYPGSPQVVMALQAFRSDPEVEALYGFSGGGYNVRHVLANLAPHEKARVKLVIVVGSPQNPPSLYERAMGIGVSARSAGRPHDGTKDVAGRAARRSRRVDEGSLRGCPDPAPEPFQPSERLIGTFINFEVCAPSAPCPPGRPCACP